METIQIILYILIAFAGIPVGFFLKKINKEEMKKGKKWFKIISFLSIIGVILGFIFTKGNDLMKIIVPLVFLFFISLVPLLKVKR